MVEKNAWKTHSVGLGKSPDIMVEQKCLKNTFRSSGKEPKCRNLTFKIKSLKYHMKSCPIPRDCHVPVMSLSFWIVCDLIRWHWSDRPRRFVYWKSFIRSRWHYLDEIKCFSELVWQYYLWSVFQGFELFPTKVVVVELSRFNACSVDLNSI